MSYLAGVNRNVMTNNCHILNRFKDNPLKRYFILIGLILMVGSSVYGQKPKFYEGYIHSQGNNKPIENAHLIIHRSEDNKVYFTNAKGKFKIPEKYLKNDFYIEVKAIGYQTFIINNLNQHTFVLKEHINELSEVVIVANKENESLRLNISILSRVKTFDSNNLWSSKLAVFIPYNEDDADKKIKTLKYRVVDFKGATGVQYLPFKSSIYSVNDISQLPDEPLFVDILVKKEFGKKWATVDISEFGIIIPKDGLFIIMQLLHKMDYKDQYISTYGGVIEVAPAIRSHQYDPGYVRKSYKYYPFSENQPDDSRWKGWQLHKGHYLIDFEF